MRREEEGNCDAYTSYLGIWHPIPIMIACLILTVVVALVILGIGREVSLARPRRLNSDTSEGRSEGERGPLVDMVRAGSGYDGSDNRDPRKRGYWLEIN